ncbi:MAG: hypothetical protein RL375_3392 [Pseudomonadota bacterium]|jgi:hypothetical protein
MSLDPIDAKARVYAEARERLAASTAALQDAITALHREHLPTIKRHLNAAFKHEQDLRALVEANPHLFTKPKTVVLHGIKCGFQKGKGSITFDDADAVVKLIKKKLPDQADVLVATKELPVKDALSQLTVAQLKSIGCKVTEAGELVIVKAVDSAVDKLVNALLKSLGDEAGIDAEEAAEPA